VTDLSDISMLRQRLGEINPKSVDRQPESIDLLPPDPAAA
jgi:hypothetical protein